MRFYTEDESQDWLHRRKRELPKLIEGACSFRIDYQVDNRRMAFYAREIARQLMFRSPVMLLITEWGIWPSSENWHLYYKLRQSYGDVRLIQDAPGHLFLEYEAEDLTSFLQLAMMNGWGGYVLAEANYVNAFFSHDEYIEFFASGEDLLTEIRKVFG